MPAIRAKKNASFSYNAQARGLGSVKKFGNGCRTSLLNKVLVSRWAADVPYTKNDALSITSFLAFSVLLHTASGDDLP
jgi:hypothetical protein